VRFLIVESEIRPCDTISMHEHAALLQLTTPPENGVTYGTVHDDISDIGNIVSKSGPMSMSMSESGPTSIEVSTSTDDHLNLTTVVEFVDPPTRMTPCELNSSCSYFIYPVENSTSLENDTMTFMCTKYPHLREKIQFYKSGKKWDDMINEIFNKLNTSTTSQRH